MGVPHERAERMAEIFNENDRRSMIALADVFDLEIPAAENDTYIAAALEIRETWQGELAAQVQAVRADSDAADQGAQS